MGASPNWYPGEGVWTVGAPAHPNRNRFDFDEEEEFPRDGNTGARISTFAGARRITLFPILLPQILLPHIILPQIILTKSPRKSGRWREIKAD